MSTIQISTLVLPPKWTTIYFNMNINCIVPRIQNAAYWLKEDKIWIINNVPFERAYVTRKNHMRFVTLNTLYKCKCAFIHVISNDNPNKRLVKKVLWPIIILQTWLVMVVGLAKTKKLAHFRDDLESIITCNWTPLEEWVANTNISETHHIRSWFKLVAELLALFKYHR